MKSSGVSDGVAGTNQKCWFSENLGKSPENMGKNSTQRCLTSENGVQYLHQNTWRPFLEVYTKKKSTWSLLEKICKQKLNGTSTPVAPLLKGQRVNALAMPLFSCFPVNIILYTLSLFIVVSYNVSLQWTKFISGLLRQSSSWLQKYPATR